MSWITDIAGRAENILNNIDKNAANVLQQTSRLGEEWTTKIYNNDNKSNLSSSSLGDLSNSSITRTKPEPLIQNVKAKYRSPIKNSNISISTSNCLAEPNEILKLNCGDGESPEKNCGNFVDAKKDLMKFKVISNELEENEISGNKEDLIQHQYEEKIQQLENELIYIRSEKNDLSNKLNESCDLNNIYMNTISELEINLKKSKKKIMEINEKLGWQTRETEQMRSELENYRKKAQNTLQMKDKIIEHLKSSSDENEVSIKYNGNILEFELNSLREENFVRTKELQDKINQVEDQKILIKDLSQKILDTKSKSQDTVTSLTNCFKLEQEKTIKLESQLKIINQEILAVRQEFNKQNQSFSRELHQKEKEILMFQTKASKVAEKSDLNNTEVKINSLTQILFQKQTAIETLTIERNALNLQLEKSQEQLHQVISVNRPQRTQIINVNDTDDVKSQLPLIMKETPFDTKVARRVKRAYSSFDSAGIRIGVFLRRYPLVRILVFMYIALLHIWVMFVLLSSTPT